MQNNSNAFAETNTKRKNENNSTGDNFNSFTLIKRLNKAPYQAELYLTLFLSVQIN